MFNLSLFMMQRWCWSKGWIVGFSRKRFVKKPPGSTSPRSCWTSWFSGTYQFCLDPYTAMTVVRGVKFFQVIYIVRSWRPKCRAFSCFFRWGCVLCASEDIFNLDEACKVGGTGQTAAVPRVLCQFLRMACCHLFGALGGRMLPFLAPVARGTKVRQKFGITAARLQQFQVWARNCFGLDVERDGSLLFRGRIYRDLDYPLAKDDAKRTDMANDRSS